MTLKSETHLLHYPPLSSNLFPYLKGAVVVFNQLSGLKIMKEAGGKTQWLGLETYEGYNGRDVHDGSLTWLIPDAVCQPRTHLWLSTRAPTCGLYIYLGLLTIWWHIYQTICTLVSSQWGIHMPSPLVWFIPSLSLSLSSQPHPK